MESLDSVDRKTSFTPSLWKQRRDFAIDKLNLYNAKSVIDLGCGQGAMLQELLDLDQFDSLLGVDLSFNALERANTACKMDRNSARSARKQNIELNLYQGSLADADARFLGCDALVSLEVIEHLDPDVVDAFPLTIFRDYAPNVAIISTPNAEFNIYFPELLYGTPDSKFRHNDHRFEWTRHEFERWATLQAQTFSYQVSFSGVGTFDYSEKGFCTQFAVFTKLNVPRDPLPLFEHYEHFAKITFPIPQENQYLKKTRLGTTTDSSAPRLPSAPRSAFCREHQRDATVYREIPREYQIRLLDKAKSRNVISVLETGAGKTLIAIMLMRHMESIVSSSAKRQVMIFLVPTVPLVVQQANYIKSNSNLKTSLIWGRMRSSASSKNSLTKEIWQEEVSDADVIVMTPDILKNALNESFLSLQDINLIIFDECHHTIGGHPYNQIMRFYFSAMIEDRPKIFGMTASPSNSSLDADIAISKLEKTLDSEAVSIFPGELNGFISRPSETIVTYNDDDFFDLPSHYTILASKYPLLLPIIDQKLYGSVVSFSQKFGCWLTNRAIELAVAAIEPSLYKKLNNIEDEFESEEFNHLFPNEMHKIANDIQELKNIENWGNIMQTPNDEDLPAKLRALINLLKNRDMNNFRGIVFVRERLIAYLIRLLFKAHPSMSEFNCEAIMGHGNSSKIKGFGNTLKMKFQKQQQILHEFGVGQINLLLATQVAEEGIDVRPCNLVVRYDIGDTLINHIQSRGRGRSSDAEFIVLLEATDVHTRTQLEALKKAEIDMIDALERNLKATEEEFVQNSKRFVVKETGVAINLENSEWMLDEYCAMLPKDDSGKPQFAEYSVILNDDNTIFVAINLPSVVPTEFRSIEGSLCKTEKFAKATAAYEMLLKLDSVGELDFLGLPGVEDANMNLDFYKERKLEDMAAAQASKTRDYFRTIPKRFEAKFEPGCQTYLNIYRLKSRKETRFLSIGFLTISKLSEQEMSFKSKINGEDYEIEIFKMNQLYELDEERYKMITKFHYGLLQISSRQMSEEVDYSWSVLCVPLAILTPDYVNVGCDPVDYIDTYSLEKCYMDNGDTKLTNLDYMYNLESLVLIDPYRFKTVFYPTSIEFDKNPGSSPDHETEKSFESIEKVYTLRFMCEEPIDMTQPIIRAHSVGFLFCAGVIPKVFPTMSLIPQLCKLSPFTRLQVNESLYLPLLFTLTWQRCMALELSHTLKTDAIPLDVVQQCLTSASASMTVDYERLETYGDAFLKAFLSTHFFIRYPIKNEGILTTMRTQYENNKYLYDVSVRLGVEGMILCQPLSRRTWIPPCNGFKQTHYLSDKTVADITEALIGAAVYYEDINAGVELIRRLFGESFESSMEPYRNEIRARNQLYSHKTVSKSLFRSIEEIETRIGYVFKYKHLMAEALTHSSYSGTHDCYQRLEFLGDAILGFLVTDNLYQYSPPMNPGQLTQCKSEFVCNQFLGWISLDLKLPAHLRHMNESIALSISNYNGEYESIKSSLEEYTTAPWYDLESSPKVLSDMFESMLGAVYVDSGLDMEVTEKILHNILSPWEKFIQITIKSVLNKSLKNDALENVNVSEVRERDGETISELSPKKLKRGNEKEESEYDIPQESGKKYDGYEINIPYMELEEETSYGKLEWDD